MSLRESIGNTKRGVMGIATVLAGGVPSALGMFWQTGGISNFEAVVIAWKMLWPYAIGFCLLVYVAVNLALIGRKLRALGDGLAEDIKALSRIGGGWRRRLLPYSLGGAIGLGIIVAGLGLFANIVEAVRLEARYLSGPVKLDLRRRELRLAATYYDNYEFHDAARVYREIYKQYYDPVANVRLQLIEQRYRMFHHATQLLADSDRTGATPDGAWRLATVAMLSPRDATKMVGPDIYLAAWHAARTASASLNGRCARLDRGGDVLGEFDRLLGPNLRKALVEQERDPLRWYCEHGAAQFDDKALALRWQVVDMYRLREFQRGTAGMLTRCAAIRRATDLYPGLQLGHAGCDSRVQKGGFTWLKDALLPRER